MKSIKYFTLITIITLNLASCAKNYHPQDPYESINRKIYVFNDGLDRTIVKPVTKGYDALLPGSVKTSVSNFFRNISLIPTIANDLLQAKPFKASEAGFRLAINSTLGLAGFFDPAQHMGLKHHRQDFGLTVAYWGNEDSSYFLLPIFGPSTLRDTAGFAVDEILLNPYRYIENIRVRNSLTALRAIDARYQLLESDKLMEDALDRYALQRDAYLQHRAHRIRQNKNLPVSNHDEADTYVE